jgi:hypothetical protein
MAAASSPDSVPDGTVSYRDPPPFVIEAQGHSFTFFPGGGSR